MKNRLNKIFTVTVIMLLVVGCSTDTFEGSTFFVDVSGGSVNGLLGETVDIDLTLQASERINTLTADGTSVEVTTGELQEEITYAFDVPGSASSGDEFEIKFILTDLAGNTDDLTVTVSIGEDASTFTEVGKVTIGGEGAAEISAYDSESEQLFVVNNDNASTIDVLDISDPASPSKTSSIDISSFGGGANSVAVSNGRLAMAIEAADPQTNGSVVV